MESNALWQRSYQADRDYHPESNYYKRQARGAMAGLRAEIGDAAYEQFAETVWPGETIDDLTWKEIHDQTFPAFKLAIGGERDMAVLIEAARQVQA